MDLERYLARIGWRGAANASGDVLSGVLAHHMGAIPFENFDVLLGRPPRLDESALEDKLVVARRGGYCFEHATLLAAALRALGFAVATHSARVIMRTPRHAAARNHMFLTVGDRVLDPGFGADAPRVPVPIGGVAGEYRFVRSGAEHTLERLDGGTWQPLWTSTLEHEHPIDFEVANHYIATHASSPFVQHILASSTIDGGDVRIANRTVKISRGGHVEERQLADRAALRAIVAEHFGFDLPELLTLRVPAVPEWAG